MARRTLPKHTLALCEFKTKSQIEVAVRRSDAKQVRVMHHLTVFVADEAEREADQRRAIERAD